MQYLTAETYARKLVTLPIDQYDNYLGACARVCDDPDDWFRQALEVEAEQQGRQKRIAKLNAKRKEL